MSGESKSFRQKTSALAQAGLEWSKQKGRDALETAGDRLREIPHELAATTVALSRQGAAELGTFCAKPFPDSFGPMDAMGTPYNPTQMQVSQEVGLYGEAPSVSSPDAPTVDAQASSPSHDAAPTIEPSQTPDVNQEIDLEP